MVNARVVLLVAVIVVTGSCTPHGDTVKLDGSPRIPDDQGIVTQIDPTRITLDGHRTYHVSENFVSFSTYTLQIEPMLKRDHQYVLLGRSGKTAEWMAGVSAVTTMPVPRAYYQGHVVRTDSQRRVIFRDGTVLRLAAHVTRPKRGALVAVTIDATEHEVTELRLVA